MLLLTFGVTLWPFLLIIMVILPEVITLSEEKLLIKKLLNDYESAGIMGRPVHNTKDKVVVEYGLGLIQILALDEKNQVLTINVWSRYNWFDQLLEWDPANYSGLTEVRVPTKKIWTPDIVLYNYADERMKEQRDVMCVVSHTGRVLWMPPAIYKSTCKINIKNFPFDQQACHLKFGSWTYDGFKLDIQFYNNKSEVNVQDYTPSNEWVILARPAKRNVKYYPCCPTPFPDLTFFLLLKRNPAFYAYLLVLPCVLLSSLTLVIFWLPPESPAKMVLGMNIFVAFFLLLLLLADSTPSASTSVPYIGYYYCLNMVLITLSTFLSLVVINLYFRGDKKNRVPLWLANMVNCVARALCMQHEVGRDESRKLRLINSEIRNTRKHNQRTNNNKSRSTPRLASHDQQSSTAIPIDNNRSAFCPSANCSRTSSGCYGDEYNQYGMSTPRQHNDVDSLIGSRVPSLPRLPQPSDRGVIHLGQNIEADLHDIRKAVQNLMTRLSEKDRNVRNAREWRTVALVLDRVFFWFYLVVIIVAGLALLMPKDPSVSIEEIIAEHTPESVRTAVATTPLPTSPAPL